VSVTDHLGRVTRLEVNADGKLTRRIDPEGKAVTYDYDLDGRPILTVDGNGNEIAMEYEALAGGGCASCSGGGSAKPSRVYYPTWQRLKLAMDPDYQLNHRDCMLRWRERYREKFDTNTCGQISRWQGLRVGYAMFVVFRITFPTDFLPSPAAEVPIAGA